MKKIDDYIIKNNLSDSAHLVLQVHDEVVYEVKKEDAEKLAKEFKEIMENVLTPKETKGIPIVAEAHIGDNWNEMKRI